RDLNQYARFVLMNTQTNAFRTRSARTASLLAQNARRELLLVVVQRTALIQVRWASSLRPQLKLHAT
ncbi:MAG: hypothetical protein ABJO88_00135, partial [Parasphingorhabdus sp.]